MAEGPCSICRRPANRDWILPLTQCEITCQRCGRYRITHGLDEWWKELRSKNDDHLPPADEQLLPYVSAYSRQSIEPPLLSLDSWKLGAERHRHTSVARKLSNLLDYFATQSAFPGQWVQFDAEVESPLFDVGSHDEMNYLLEHLVNIRTLEKAATQAQKGQLRLTVSGWNAVSPITGGGVPGRCFIAMAFDSTLNEAYDEGIKPAAIACGLKPIRVDNLEHNGVVTDVIMAEIRRAQVMVADVTLHRQGVYFEAGFALGLGRTVIWTCKKDDMASAHFDTRQYSHVLWTDAQDLRKRLEARIRATVLHDSKT